MRARLEYLYQKKKARLEYLCQNWKLIVHLLFSTYRFGVNNEWWSTYDSMFGRPLLERIMLFTICDNYLMMRFRAEACHSVGDKKSAMLFGKGTIDDWKIDTLGGEAVKAGVVQDET